MFTLCSSQFPFDIFPLFQPSSASQQQPQQLHGAAAALASASHIFRRLMINYFSIKRQHKTQLNSGAAKNTTKNLKLNTRQDKGQGHGPGGPQKQYADISD